MTAPIYNCLVVLGPTASGKTRLGVRLAAALKGEIISADSRQVYRELTIGAGKDLEEYCLEGRRIPYHLIDVVGLNEEFSVFQYQKSYFEIFKALQARKVLPIIVGGTGLYLEAVLKGYALPEVPANPALRQELENQPISDLIQRLQTLKPRLHNTSDFKDPQRLIRAIEIAQYTQTHVPAAVPEVKPFILGVAWPRPELRERIALRLQYRLEHGLVEEVSKIREQGIGWEKLRQLGLEYRYVADYLARRLASREALYQKLFLAICDFAKRQETWFRRMERQGQKIHWVNQGQWETAWQLVKENFPEPLT